MEEPDPKPNIQIPSSRPEDIWSKQQLIEMIKLATQLHFWDDVKDFKEALKRIEEKERQNG